MSQNPFEAPRAQDAYSAPQYASPNAGNGTFDIGVAVQEAWARTTANAGILIGGSFLAVILFIVSYITILGIFLLVPVFGYGMVRLLLDAHDGEPEIGALFAGFQDYGRALGGMLMLLLGFLVLQSPVYLMSIGGIYLESMALSLGSNVVSLVLTFGVLIRLYFAPFFIVDQGMGGIDAMKASWEATSHQKLMNFLLMLVVGIIGMSGIFALLIGLVFTIPLSYMVYVSAYRQIVGPRTTA